MLVPDHRRFSGGSRVRYRLGRVHRSRCARAGDLRTGATARLRVRLAVSFGSFVRPRPVPARNSPTAPTLAGITDDLKSLADLHPKRMLASTFSDPAPSDPPAPASAQRPQTTHSAGGTTPGTKPGAAFDPTRPERAPESGVVRMLMTSVSGFPVCRSSAPVRSPESRPPTIRREGIAGGRLWRRPPRCPAGGRSRSAPTPRSPSRCPPSSSTG